MVIAEIRFLNALCLFPKCSFRLRNNITFPQNSVMKQNLNLALFGPINFDKLKEN